MDYYFVYSGKSSLETEVIQELQPPGLLLSHGYFQHKNLVTVKKLLGYEPKILYNSGRDSSIHYYMDDIMEKKPHLEKYLCMDERGNNEQTFLYYQQMKRAGLKPVPIFHFSDDLYYLDQYAAAGERFVALGGSRELNSPNAVREYTAMICWQYPEIHFHLLGTGSKHIIDHCDLHSATASTWIMAASYGRPRHIKGTDKAAKKQRAAFNMKQLLSIPE